MFLKRNDVCVAMSMEELDSAIFALRKNYDDTKAFLARLDSIGSPSSIAVKKGLPLNMICFGLVVTPSIPNVLYASSISSIFALSKKYFIILPPNLKYDFIFAHFAE